MTNQTATNMNQSPPKLKSTLRTALYFGAFAFIPIQLLVLYLLGARDGKYHDPRHPVDGELIGHFLLFMSLYLTTLVIGLLVASLVRNWISLGIQVLIPIAIVVLIAIGITRPVPTYNADDFQDLVGQPIKQVRSKLDSRGVVSSVGGTRFHPKRHYLSYRGMEIVADSDGKIIEVNPNNRD